uniref:Trissin n=1 Tax=Anopheles arabiensis TaxID=7173 RepID=A0A182IGC2_ANOAR
MNPAAYVSIIFGCCVLWVACSFPVALSCDSCGRECASACGTRHFRTCCFNYLRKRSSPPSAASATIDKRLELLYGTKSVEQKPQTMLSSLTNIDSTNVEGGIDYEYVPILSTKHFAIGKTQSAPKISLQRKHDSNIPELDDNNEKSSEESESGSLQLFYES